MKEMKTLKFPNQDEPYEIVDGYAREQLDSLITETWTFTLADGTTVTKEVVIK